MIAIWNRCIVLKGAVFSQSVQGGQYPLISIKDLGEGLDKEH